MKFTKLLFSFLFLLNSYLTFAGSSSGWVSFDTYADMKLRAGTISMVSRLQGRYFAGDGWGGDYLWDTTAVSKALPDDSFNIIHPSVTTSGVWRKLAMNYKIIAPLSGDSNNVIVTDASGNIVKVFKDKSTMHMSDTAVTLATQRFVANYVSSHALSGPTGNTGPTGSQGATGNDGTMGIQGNTGPTGATGIQGLQGVTGLNGVDGLTGPTGIQGPSGINGSNGAQGIQGITGATGANGTNGIQGNTGLTGSQGLIGPTGLTGPQGLVGVTGSTGVMGLQGVTGLQGIIGVTGSQGPTGSQGITGATGLNGTNGTVGATGATGLTGSVGATGNIGVTGPTGQQGLTGNIGVTGAAGPADSSTFVTKNFASSNYQVSGPASSGTVASNAVTINAYKGTINIPSGLLGIAATFSFTLTDSYLATTSNIQLQINGSGNTLNVPLQPYIKSKSSGSCVINLLNISLLSVLNTGVAIDFVILN